MPTSQAMQLHYRPGLRWIAPFLALNVVILIGLFLMLVYPHLSF